MKKMIVLLVVLAVAFAVVLPAAAAGNGPGGAGNGTGIHTGTGTGQQGARGTLAISGTIGAVGTDTITVEVLRGNKLVQAYIGTQVSVNVTASTRYLLREGNAITLITFADLKAGQKVSMNVTVNEGTWTA